jgi:DNA-binding Lrp family transcriptional regulator
MYEKVQRLVSVWRPWADRSTQGPRDEALTVPEEFKASVYPPYGPGEGVQDELDRRIIAALQVNPRASWHQIAGALGTSVSTISRRANRLFEQKVVRIGAIPDPLALQVGYPVLLQITCHNASALSVANTLASRPEVRFVALLTGAYDVIVEVIVDSRSHLASILSDQIGQIEGISRTTSESVTRNFKTSYEWGNDVLGDAAHMLTPTYATSKAPAPAMDGIDTGLIQLLGEDGRRSLTDLATNLSISESMARRRLDALVSSGVLRLGAVIDPQLLGFDLEIFVWLDVDLGELEAVAEALALRPEIRYISTTAGYSNIACEVVLRDQMDLYRFQTQVLGSLPGIRRAELGIELRTIKRGFLTAGEV